MSDKNRSQWTGRIGFILAAAGSAVGLGNIWKFPGRAFDGGGGAYILIYLACVLLIGIPVMLSELSVGRAGGADAVGSMKKLDRRFSWVGYLSFIIPFIIGCYYSHVGGWVLRYAVSYVTEPAAVYSQPLGYFYGLLGYDAASGETWFPLTAIIFAGLFIAACGLVIIRGVEGGIEKFNRIGMPALFVILIILFIRAVTLPGASEGLSYMLTCDWSKVTFGTFLSALGQSFYSLSLGMGIMLTYGSYVSKKENLAQNTIVVCTMDTLVALISGFIIIPSVFATLGADGVGKGAGFAFVSLAGVFEQMPLGQLFAVLFYVLLLFAALTSCVSIIEAVVAYIIEEIHMNRIRATILTCVSMFLIGCLYVCTQASYSIPGIWFDFANGISYPPFCDFMEYLTDRLLIPVCALGIAVFVGWVWKPSSAIAEVCREGNDFAWKRVYAFLIRYLVPAAIALILIFSFVTGTTLS